MIMADKNDIQMKKVISYSPNLDQPISPLLIVNKSNKNYVFKIRTNQKTVVSLFNIYGFIKPNSNVQIPIRLIEKPAEGMPVKLQVNYTIATEQQLLNNNSKQTIAAKTSFLKEIVTLKAQQKKIPVIRKPPQVKMAQNGQQQDIMTLLQKPIHQPTDNADTQNSGQVDLFQSTQTHRTEQHKFYPRSLFKHTFSKRIDTLITPQSEQEGTYKMDIFQSIQRQSEASQSAIQCQSETSQSASKRLSSIKEQILNPFNTLQKSDKGLNFPPQESIGLQLSKQKQQNNIFQAIKYMRHPPQNPQPQQEEHENGQRNIFKSMKQTGWDKQNQNRQKQMRQRQSQLLQLKIKIECYNQFVIDLQSIQNSSKQRKYPKWLFLLISILSFVVGAIAKLYAF